MSGTPHPPADAAAEPLWADVGNRLLQGVAHTLSNRAHAVLGISAGMDDLASPLVPMLRDEATRLEGAVRLLRLLARTDSAQPEPMRAEDLLADACALHAQRTDVSATPVSLQIDEAAPPVRVDPTAALHALLLLFDAVGGEHEGALTVHAARAGATLELHLMPPTGQDTPGSDGGASAANDDILGAATRLLAADGGRVDRNGTAVIVSLPALGGTQ